MAPAAPRRIPWAPIRSLRGEGTRLPPRYLGILADRRPGGAGSGRLFYEQTDFIAELLAAARRLGVPAYAFGPQDVAPAARRVRGWTPEGARWRAGWYPLPALVYDRFFRHTPGAAGRALLRRYRRLKRSGRLRWLEPELPDKLKLYRVLAADPAVAPHLPPTRPCRGAADLTAALERWTRVVVKHRRGGKGIGVWFLRRRSDGTVTVRRGNESRAVRLDGAGLRAWLRRRLRRGGYVVQPWLDLRVWQGRPVDLRILVQRDGKGTLQVTGGGARVGARGRLVANLHRGGQAVPLEAVLAPFGLTRPQVYDLALRVCRVLDARCGPVAEVGVDLAVDRRGRLWVLEANSRPGRTIFRKLGDRETRSLAVARPIAYAAFLLSGGKPQAAPGAAGNAAPAGAVCG